MIDTSHFKLFVRHGVNILCEENDKNRQREVLNTNHIVRHPRRLCVLRFTRLSMMRKCHVCTRIYLLPYTKSNRTSKSIIYCNGSAVRLNLTSNCSSVTALTACVMKTTRITNAKHLIRTILYVSHVDNVTLVAHLSLDTNVFK